MKDSTENQVRLYLRAIEALESDTGDRYRNERRAASAARKLKGREVEVTAFPQRSLLRLSGPDDRIRGKILSLVNEKVFLETKYGPVEALARGITEALESPQEDQKEGKIE